MDVTVGSRWINKRTGVVVSVTKVYIDCRNNGAYVQHISALNRKTATRIDNFVRTYQKEQA